MTALQGAGEGDAPAAQGRPPFRLGARFWAVNLAAWTLLGAFLVSRWYVMAWSQGKPLPDERLLILNGLEAVRWALFTPLIFALAARYPFGAGRWMRSLPPHAALALAMVLAGNAMRVLVADRLWPDEPADFWRYLAAGFHQEAQWYVVAVMAFHAVAYATRLRDREVRTARMETHLARAQLDALKMQIQPYFLFNTLHAVSEMVHEDADGADRMITRLGDLLRLTVDDAAQEVPLRRELQLLAAYLEIERTRFRERLTVETDVDPHTLDALVPSLVLQPLVEHAIHRGTAHCAHGLVRLSVRRGEAGLALEVRDSGAPLAGALVGESAGLRATRARLTRMYGDAHALSLDDAPEGGAVLRVSLPWREGDPSADAAPSGAGLAVHAVEAR